MFEKTDKCLSIITFINTKTKNSFMEGRVLKKKLLEINRSQKELAELLGITAQSVSAILSAKDVRSGTIEKIAQVLGVSISYLYGEKKSEQHVIASGNKSVAAINSSVSVQNVDVLRERIKSLEALVAEKERTINILIGKNK